MRTMYDAADGTVVFPTPPDAVAGYVNGNFVSAPALFARYPFAKHLPITVQAVPIWSAAINGVLCLDIESGDARPTDAGPWAKAAIDHGVTFPWLYFSTSNHDAVVSSVRGNGLNLGGPPFFWGAQWDNDPRIMPGYVAKQYQSLQAWDTSSVIAYVPGFDPAPPPPKPRGGDAEMFACTTVTAKCYVVSDSFIMATDTRGVEKFVSTGMPFCDNLADETITALTEGGKRPILNQ